MLPVEEGDKHTHDDGTCPKRSLTGLSFSSPRHSHFNPDLECTGVVCHTFSPRFDVASGSEFDDDVDDEVVDETYRILQGFSTRTLSRRPAIVAGIDGIHRLSASDSLYEHDDGAGGSVSSTAPAPRLIGDSAKSMTPWTSEFLMSLRSELKEARDIVGGVVGHSSKADMDASDFKTGISGFEELSTQVVGEARRLKMDVCNIMREFTLCREKVCKVVDANDDTDNSCKHRSAADENLLEKSYLLIDAMRAKLSDAEKELSETVSLVDDVCRTITETRLLIRSNGDCSSENLASVCFPNSPDSHADILRNLETLTHQLHEDVEQGLAEHKRLLGEATPARSSVRQGDVQAIAGIAERRTSTASEGRRSSSESRPDQDTGYLTTFINWTLGPGENTSLLCAGPGNRSSRATKPRKRESSRRSTRSSIRNTSSPAP